MPLINILTRTSNRPNVYKRNRQNILNQKYSNIFHIVSVDDEKDLSYVKENEPDKIVLFTGKENLKEKYSNFSKMYTCNTNLFFEHNLYLNEMQKDIKDGWVLYLDDDDIFMDDTSLRTIVHSIRSTNEDTLIIWQMDVNGIIVPEEKFFNTEVPVNHIGGSCFTFHSKWLKYAIWPGWQFSDHMVFAKLYNNIPNKEWIEKPLIYVHTMGKGTRKDI